MVFDRDEVEAAFAAYRALIEAPGEGDWLAWAELFTEDAVYTEHGSGATFVGRPAITEWVVGLMAGYPALTTWIDWYQVEGDRVAFYVWNSLPDPAGGGRSFQFPNTGILRYAGEGRFDREDDFYNPADAERIFTAWFEAGGRRRTPKDDALQGIPGWQPAVPTPSARRDEVERELLAYRERGAKAVTTGDWNPWADQFTDDARYLDHHHGRFEGREAIREWAQRRPPLPAMELSIRWSSIEGNRISALARQVVPDTDEGLDLNVILHYAGEGRWSYAENVYNPHEASAASAPGGDSVS